MELNNLECINLKQAKQKLLEMFSETWCEQATSVSKLYLHVNLHDDDMRVASHVNSNLNKGIKTLVSQIHCGILPLNIELLRYQGLPQHECICSVCDKDVESELHFLFECEFYHEARLDLYCKLPDLLNEASLVKRFEVLCRTPYTLGNKINRIRNERNEKLNFHHKGVKQP